MLAAANRLIGRNTTRYEPDKRLRTSREDGSQVEVVVCAGAEDEAVAIVDAMQEHHEAGTPWSEMAVLYRKHRHREAIVARLQEEDIPYTVVGGLSLFATPEIRDLEQGLRAIADPHDDVALTRMMTAGPWRLDALEILHVSRTARFDNAHLVDVVQQIVTAAEATANASADATTEPTLRAKLRRLLDVIQELQPQTFREGPFTILQRYLELTGQVLDMVAVGSTDAHRIVANIASFLRFAADWQAQHPEGTLGGFVDYLDAYQAAGGELPTSVELTEDVEGVRLMTLYQAKGLEFRHVFIPQLLVDEWPTREGYVSYFPEELLRERIQGEEIHTQEERRLLYVAITRAQDRLMLTTHAGPSAEKGSSLFVGEVLEGEDKEVTRVDRTSSWALPEEAEPDEAHADAEADGAATDRSATLLRRVMPLPSKRERRLELRLRANELIELLEGTNAADAEATAARAGLEARLADVGRSAAMAADAARAAGLDPLTLRHVAGDGAAGANLLEVAALPEKFSYSSLDTYERCPLQYAFRYVYKIPQPDRPVAAFAFGSAAHEAFEAFTRERRERLARGEEPPTREDLERHFRELWVPADFGDRPTEEAYQRRVTDLLDNFWTGEVSSIGQAIVEEQAFDLVIEDPDGGPPVVIGGFIDRIDRLPSGAVEVIDYKTGKMSSQKDVAQSLQLSIYALACRDALGLGTPGEGDPLLHGVRHPHEHHPDR